MSDQPPSDQFMRALLADVFMIHPEGIYADSGKGPERISASLTREQVDAEPCKCIRCSFCRGSGRDPYDEVGMGSDSPCEECGGSGIVETCSRCEYLAELDLEP